MKKGLEIVIMKYFNIEQSHACASLRPFITRSRRVLVYVWEIQVISD